MHVFYWTDVVPCDDGDVRLIPDETMGPLKVCVKRRWITVCYSGWSDIEASVVCRQLGYSSGEGKLALFMIKEIFVLIQRNMLILKCHHRTCQK